MNICDYLQCDEFLAQSATHTVQITPGERSDEVSVLTSSTKKFSTQECIDEAVDGAISQTVSIWLGATVLSKRGSCSESSKEELPVRKQAKMSCEDASMMDSAKSVSVAPAENLEEYQAYLRRHAGIFQTEILAETPADSRVTEAEFDLLFRRRWRSTSERVIKFDDVAQQALFLLIKAKRAIFSQRNPEIKFHERVSDNVDDMKKQLEIANAIHLSEKSVTLKFFIIKKDKDDVDEEPDKVYFVDEYFKSHKTCHLLKEICKDMWLVVRCGSLASLYDDSNFEKYVYYHRIAREKIADIGEYMRSYLDLYVLESVDLQPFTVETTFTFLENLFEKFDIGVKDCVHSTARKNLKITFIMIEECYTMLPSNVALFCLLSSLKTHDVCYDVRQMANFVVIPENMGNLIIAPDASEDIQKSIVFIEGGLETFESLLQKNTENVPTSPTYDPS